MRIFFESPSLAKRYVEDAGSDRVEALGGLASKLAVNVICQLGAAEKAGLRVAGV